MTSPDDRLSAAPSAALRAGLSDRYTLERELGAGGMATVYLAEDLKHHRKVALKVLRPDLAAALGPDRFMQEIEIAARLQHPHILPVHDSGNADGFLYYVMPYVEGESLRERLSRQGELPIHEAVRLLSEIADALGHAHSRGVVHRDIKPENVMLSGRHALVMDFGVAKAVSEASGRNKLTTLGVALGTPAYMAPEQASADPHLDHRVDVYALGVVGYELLTGRQPFMGGSPQQVLAAHVTQAPEPVTTHRPTISPALAAVIMKALAKRPADRWQTAEEMLTQLEPLATPSGGLTPTETRPVAATRVQRPSPKSLFIGVGMVGIAAIAWLILNRTKTPAIILGKTTQVTNMGGLEILPDISPDGKNVAYVAGTLPRMRIWVQPVAGGRPIALTGDSAAPETKPRWSPDGSSILYLSRGGVWVASAPSGTARSLIPTDSEAAVTTAAWSPDGREVVFARDTALQVYTIADGKTRIVTKATNVSSCAWSPRGGLIACSMDNPGYSTITRSFGNTGSSRIFVVPATGGPKRVVTDFTSLNESPVWAQDGRRFYFVSDREGARDVFVLGITAQGDSAGAPIRLTTTANVHSISLSQDGQDLAYSVFRDNANIWALPIPMNPPVTIAGAVQVTSGNQRVEAIRASYDGKWLLYDSNLRGNADIFRLPLPGGEPEQLTRDPANDYWPSSSPDGKEIAFHSTRNRVRHVFVQPLDGRPAVQVPSGSLTGEQGWPSWSPTGDVIAFFAQRSTWIVRRARDGSWGTPLLRFSEHGGGRWSPDGKFLLAGRSKLLIFGADSGAPRVVYEARSGSDDPIPTNSDWSPDGETIYFKSLNEERGASFWSLSVAGGRPRLLVQLDDPARQSYQPYWATDGKRFYFPVSDRESDVWVVELKRP